MTRTSVVLAFVIASLPARALAADADPWLGKDKALHFAAESTLAAGGYVIGAALFDARGYALVTGAALAAAAGIGKETLDLTGYGDPSWRDLAWDGIGMTAGLVVAWSMDLLVRGVSPRHPLFVAPTPSAHGGGAVVRFAF